MEEQWARRKIKSRWISMLIVSSILKLLDLCLWIRYKCNGIIAGKWKKNSAKSSICRLRELRSPACGTSWVSSSSFYLMLQQKWDIQINTCHQLLVRLDQEPTSVTDNYFSLSCFYGMDAGSGGTKWKKLHILGKMLLTWHKELSGPPLMLGAL